MTSEQCIKEGSIFREKVAMWFWSSPTSRSDRRQTYYKQRWLADGKSWETWLWFNSSLPNPPVCLELNQQAAAPAPRGFSPADRGCFACLLQSARQCLAEISAVNPLLHTCLSFIRKARIATSSWRSRCWSLMSYVCHLIFILYPNSTQTTFFLLLLFFITYASWVSWSHFWETLIIYCLVWMKLTQTWL